MGAFLVKKLEIAVCFPCDGVGVEDGCFPIVVNTIPK